MTKLLEHIKAMQAKATQFLTPETYVDRGGKKADDDSPNYLRPELFINDILYMLDGPEQREAEEAAVSETMQLEQAAEWRLDIRKQVEQADAVAKSWKDKADKLKVENNDLRSKLMTSELAYARVMGYLDGRRDSEPPVMVPQPRETFLAQMPDGTQGTRFGGWAGGHAGYRPNEGKEWFHR